MNLFEISQEIKKLEEEIEIYAEENLGLVPEEAFNKLNDLYSDSNAKMEAIYKLIKNKSANIKALQDVKKEFDKKIKFLNNSVERLENLARANLEEGEKFNYGIASFGWRKSEKLLINDEQKVPDSFCDYVKTVNKKDLKDYIKSGGLVAGVEIKKFNNLQVK